MKAPCLHNWLEVVVRLTVLQAGRALLQERSSGTYFCYSSSKTHGYGAAGRIRLIVKKIMISPGLKTTTFRPAV
jgi:hypothetical protein